jgi:hypothetical protein
MLSGQVSTGACVSFTVMVKLQNAGFPAVSVTQQLTVVTPLGKVEPLGGWQVGKLPDGELAFWAGPHASVPGQLSVIVGEG